MYWDIGTLNRGKRLPEKIRKKISLKKIQQLKNGKLNLPDSFLYSRKGKKAWNKGIPRTPQEKQKMSEAVLKLYKQGRKTWNKGIKLSPEIKKKISEAKKLYWAKVKKEIAIQKKQT